MFQTAEILLASLVICLACCRCGASMPPGSAAPPGRAAEKDVTQAVAGNNEFALDLYGQLKSRPGNLFFSPASISTALAMTYAGARGDTQAEMAKALHFGESDDAFHAAFGQIARDLNAGGQQGGYQLRLANALWAQKGYKFLESFTNLVTRNYQAGLRELDFQSDPKAARKTINSWVEQQTNDKIRDLLKPGVVDHATRLVLTNAIYFKGDWREPFQKDRTNPGPFTRADQTKAEVPLMNQTAYFKHAQGDGFQTLELPYAGGDLAMVVLLPDKIDGLGDLESKLARESLAAALARLRSQRVTLWLPKFKMTSALTLKDPLSSLGMKLAFTDAADFSGMTGSKDLVIEHVVHQAFVDVNEQGTEAAAATGIAVGATAVRVLEPPIVFRADHPFLFFIRDNRSGSILFLGRVADPAAG